MEEEKKKSTASLILSSNMHNLPTKTLIMTTIKIHDTKGKAEPKGTGGWNKRNSLNGTCLKI